MEYDRKNFVVAPFFSTALWNKSLVALFSKVTVDKTFPPGVVICLRVPNKKGDFVKFCLKVMVSRIFPQPVVPVSVVVLLLMSRTRLSL